MRSTLTLAGNLTSNVTLRATAGGAVANFRMAVNDDWFDKKSGQWRSRTVYLQVSAWRRLAEHAADSLALGQPVLVVGRLRQREYEKDGQSHTVVEDTCDFIEDWLNSPDPRASESQDSRSAVSDILALVQGVENAYLGGIEGKRGHGLHELVAAKDPVLDRRIQIAQADLRHRVANVGDPYGAPAADRDLKLRIATASCWKLANKYAAAIVPVCMDPATDPWAAYGK